MMLIIFVCCNTKVQINYFKVDTNNKSNQIKR